MNIYIHLVFSGFPKVDTGGTVMGSQDWKGLSRWESDCTKANFIAICQFDYAKICPEREQSYCFTTCFVFLKINVS